MNSKVKGFPDWSSQDSQIKSIIVSQLNALAFKYGTKLIDLPTIEYQNVFTKALGSDSTIVQKQFFYLDHQYNSFNERMVLRPEFSSGIVRNLFEQNLLNVKKNNLYFSYGSCFRYEKPQKGRYREFFQWNLEQIPFQADELPKSLILLNNILEILNIKDKVLMEINFLTSNQLEKAQTLFEKNFSQFLYKFCSLCQQRYYRKNIFRILDCKDCQPILTSKNFDLETLLKSEEVIKYQNYQKQLQLFLPNLEIKKNSKLTRGLDYYTELVFEIKPKNNLWSQDTLLAGGVYNLNAFFNNQNQNQFFSTNSFEYENKKIPIEKKGFGFALGLDRYLVFQKELSQNQKKVKKNPILICFFNEKEINEAYKLQVNLVNENILAVVQSRYSNFKSIISENIEKLNKTAILSQWLIIFGKEYQENKKLILRKITLKSDESPIQKILSISEAISFLKEKVFI